MANLTEQQREENRARRMGKAQRGAARDLAREHAIKALTQQIGAGPPEWFTPDQVDAYRDQTRHYLDRLGISRLDPHHRTLKPALARGRA